MSSKRYKYATAPPVRSKMSIYTQVEQTVYDALIEADFLSNSSCNSAAAVPLGESARILKDTNRNLPMQYDTGGSHGTQERNRGVQKASKIPSTLDTSFLEDDTENKLRLSVVTLSPGVAPPATASLSCIIGGNKYCLLMPPPRAVQHKSTSNPVDRPSNTSRVPTKSPAAAQHNYQTTEARSNLLVSCSDVTEKSVTSKPPCKGTGNMRSGAAKLADHQCKITDYTISASKQRAPQQSTPPSYASAPTQPPASEEVKSINNLARNNIHTPSPGANKRRSSSVTPKNSGKRRKSKLPDSESFHHDEAKHEVYLLENKEKLVDLIEKAEVILCITSHEKRYPLCNDAKSLFSQLLDSNILLETDIHSLKFNDVCLASWLLNPDEFNKQSLYPSENSVEKVGQSNMAKELLSRFTIMSEQLKERKMWNVYELELSVVPVLVVMECQGLVVDIAELNRVDKLMSSEIKALERKAGTCIGSPISLNSTVQLRQVLYDRLKLDKHLPKTTLYKTAKGQKTSTCEGVLNQLLPYHSLPKIILDYRQLYKVHSTYISAMRGYISDGVIRTQWDQTSASTGRLQSTKPNIQAIPKNSLTYINEKGDDVTICPRSIYKSHDGYTFLSVDFKQIELRVFAHITGDKKLGKVLRDDQQDIFFNLSAIWMNKRIEDVTEADRDKTKKVVYSVMYGVGKYKLSQQLNITPMEAQSVMSRFLRDFPEVQRFTNKIVTSCRQKGYATSLLGRRRLLKDMNSKIFQDRTHAERQAVNFTIQGSAADICKLVMREISKELRESSIKASLIVQIHDELLYEVIDAHISQAKSIFVKCMETDGGVWHDGLQLSIPLRISVKAGKYWAVMNPC